MSGWTHNDLEQIGAAEELQLATFKEDGTRRMPIEHRIYSCGSRARSSLASGSESPAGT